MTRTQLQIDESTRQALRRRARKERRSMSAVAEQVLREGLGVEERRVITARKLLKSGLIGMWQDRDDITDSSAFARKLREQAQRRRD